MKFITISSIFFLSLNIFGAEKEKPEPKIKRESWFRKDARVLKTSEEWEKIGALNEFFPIDPKKQKVVITDRDGWRYSKINWSKTKITKKKFLELAGTSSLYLDNLD